MDTLKFLYRTIPGRMILKFLTRPSLSNACGRFLDSDLSHFLIQPFVKEKVICVSYY